MNKEYQRLMREHLRRLEVIYMQIAGQLGNELYKHRHQIAKIVGDRVVLNKQVQIILNKAHKTLAHKVTLLSNRGIKEMWEASNLAQDAVADTFLMGLDVSPIIRKQFFVHNYKGLNAYLNKTKYGMNLSERIWKRTKVMNGQIRQYCGSGVLRGKNSGQMVRDIKDCLIEPDRLFRRVRDEGGKLHLSKAAKDYHPGQGVYRSSYKNAMRIIREENNGSFRYSDHLRWREAPYVYGVQVNLSAAHPETDICDDMAGEYPKGFHFPGWHAQCICYATSINMKVDEFKRYMSTGDVNRSKLVAKIPDKAQRCLIKNKSRIHGLKNAPYWMDNFEPDMRLKDSVKSWM